MSTAIECLQKEWTLFEAAERDGTGAIFLLWEVRRPVVVLGHTGTVEEVFEPACALDDVPILRRRTGGGSVVLGPGCLNYGLIISLVSHPALRDVSASYRFILQRIVQAVGVPGLTIEGSADLVFRGRKVSGNAQRRGQRTLIHHGTLLYDFDAGLAAKYLREPVRHPEYRARRTHAEFLGNLPVSAPDLRTRLERLAPI
jgi:lipoate-protein ligase A